MSSRCTGECCKKFTLTCTRPELRRLIDVEQNAEAAIIWTLVRESHIREDGRQAYRCAALTPSGCSLEYESRPIMCQAYPYNGAEICQHCHSGSDAEARGVALMVSA